MSKQTTKMLKKRMSRQKKVAVISSAVFVSLTLLPIANHLFLYSNILYYEANAQTNNSANIASVTDTSSNSTRGFSWGGTTSMSVSSLPDPQTFSYIRNNANLLSSPSNITTFSTKNDPLGQTYVNLVQNTGNEFGYAVIKNPISSSNDFSVTGFFNPTNLASNGSSNSGDWVGLVFLPQDPTSVTPKAGDGGSLGISGFSNALALGVDMYNNQNYQDPSNGPFGALRWTDSSGTIQGFGSMNNLYTSSANLTYWDGNNSQGGRTMQYQMTYHYNGGTPYITGFISDYSYNGYVIVNNDGSYTSQNGGGGQNTSQTGTNFFMFDTRNPGGGTPLTITPPSTGEFTVAINASNGANYQSMNASIDQIKGQEYAAQATINYLVDPNATSLPTNISGGATVAPSTTLTSGAGDMVGIQNVSAGAIAGTDTYTYANTVPSTATAQYQSGWHVSRTLSTQDGKPDLTFSATNANNNYTVYYAPDIQTAKLAIGTTPNMSNPPSSESHNGVTGGTLSMSATDSTLARAGYTYTVNYQDGTNGTVTNYPTLAAALAANPTYDTTTNGTATTDSTPQIFTVNYTANAQTVTINYIDNNGNTIGVTTVSGTTNGTTWTSATTLASTTTATKATDGAEDLTATSNVAISVPTLTGYTPNVTSVTPSFVVNSNGTPTTPSITVTYTANVQQANLQIDYLNTTGQTDTSLNSSVVTPNVSAGVQNLPMQTGVTGGTYIFNVASALLPGYYTGSALVSGTTLSGTYDSTNNGTSTSDSSPQNLTITANPCSQSLNLTYTFPTGLTPSDSYTQILQTTTNQTFDITDAMIPSFDGYTTEYTYNGVTTSSMPTITADTTSNGANAIDSTPQTVLISYNANFQQANLVVEGAMLPNGETNHQALTSATGTTGGTITFSQSDSDLNYEGYSYTVTGPDGKTYNTLAQALSANSTFDNTANSGASDSNIQTFTVDYSSWAATMNYFVQQVDASGKPIGALSQIKDYNGEQSASGQMGPNNSSTDFTSTTMGGYGTSISDASANLIEKGMIPAGYHVQSSYWSNTPDGMTQTQTPPYTTDWNYTEMTNTGTNATVNEQAAIVYLYTGDTQSANVTISGVPASATNATNGTTTYTGTTATTCAVTLSNVPGYTVSVTDGNDNPVNVSNGGFTLTYDNTTNGESSTDSTPQTYNVIYTANSASVQVGYAYSNDTTASVIATPSTDTAAYTAPALPNAVQIDTQTGGEYSLTVPNVTGYTWTVTDSNGDTYTADTLPASFTNDGNNISYTVTYAPATPASPNILIHFYEATYNNDGTFAFTTNEVPNMPQLSYNGPTGSLLDFAITKSFINNNTTDTIPDGWSLDPMGASVAVVDDSDNEADNDNLNGANTAKELLFTPNASNYIVYLARDIQSVQVQFTGDPQNTATIYSDGRTGENFNVSTDSFVRDGYTYTITDPSGDTVSSISGTYDATNNDNASNAILNNGDGDSSPQVYTVAYTAQTQTATLSFGGTTYTSTGPTGSAISFTATDTDVQNANPGYSYTVDVTTTNPDGTTTTTSYSSLSNAIAANKYYPADDSSASNYAPTTFSVSYTASFQEAQLVTDNSDPNGANDDVDTITGKTGTTLAFPSNDSNSLNRPGYTLSVEGPDEKAYTTLDAAVKANSTFDTTNNGNSNTDSDIQVFTASYTANPQSVTINFVDQYGNSIGSTTATGTTNGSTWTTTTTLANGTTLADDTTVTNGSVPTAASSNPISVPTIPGFTPNVTSVMPNFHSVNPDGTLAGQTIQVTYTANPQTATITYGDSSGQMSNSDLTAFAASANDPTSANGGTNSSILTGMTVPANTAALTSVPTLPGYTFTSWSWVQSDGTTAKTGTDNALSGVNFTAPDNAPDSVVLIYTPKVQKVTITYIKPDGTTGIVTVYGYSNGDEWTTTAPDNNGELSNLSNAPLDLSNLDGADLTDVPGYTASTSTITPNFAIDNNGNLVTPNITVGSAGVDSSDNLVTTTYSQTSTTDSNGNITTQTVTQTVTKDSSGNVLSISTSTTTTTTDAQGNAIGNPTTTTSDSLDTSIIPSAVTYTPDTQTATIAYTSTATDANGDSSGGPTNIASKSPSSPTTVVGVTGGLMNIQPQNISGYTATEYTRDGVTYEISGNANPADDLANQTFSADPSQNTITFVYTPNKQVVAVHYVFQVPSGYSGDYIASDGTKYLLVYSNTQTGFSNPNELPVLENGDPVPDMPSTDNMPCAEATVSEDGTKALVTGVTDEADTTISATAPNEAFAVSSSPSGISGAEASQSISWAINDNDVMNVTDYYFYVSPTESNVQIQYKSTDGNDAKLDALIPQTTTGPILDTKATGGQPFQFSGAMGIAGYTYAYYIYNDGQNTAEPGSATDGSSQMTSFDYDGTSLLQIYYTPNVQTTTITYYDQNGNPIPTNELPDDAVVSVNGTSNGDSWTATEKDGTVITGSVSNGDSFPVPEISGLTSSVSSITPDFSLNCCGVVTQAPTSSINVTYSANPQTSTVSYTDENGNNITSFATGAGAPSSTTGVTGAPIFFAPDGTADPIVTTTETNDGTPELDSSGNPVLDMNGNPMYSSITNTTVTKTTTTNTVNTLNPDGTITATTTTTVTTVTTTTVSTMSTDDKGNMIMTTGDPTMTTTTSDPLETTATIALPVPPGYSITGYTVTDSDGDTTTTNINSLLDLGNLTYSGNGNKISLICSPNPQTVNVHYVYASGTKQGNDVVFSDGTHLDTLSGVSNGTTPDSYLDKYTTPQGYSLLTDNPLAVNWSINNSGNLNYPDLYFYYQPNSAAALVHYGLTTSDNGSLDSIVPNGTITGMQNGLTDSTIPLGTLDSKGVADEDGAVEIEGYDFAGMYYNGVEVATTTGDANAYLATYTGAQDGDVVYFIYTAKTGTITYKYVDTNGNEITSSALDSAVTTSNASTGQTMTTPTPPQIPGYTIQTVASPNGITSTDSSGNTSANVTMPQSGNTIISYIYTADDQVATVTYQSQNPDGTLSGMGIGDTSLDGLTDQVIATSPTDIDGYTFTGATYNGVEIEGAQVGASLPASVVFTAPDADNNSQNADNIVYTYTPNQQNIVLNFVYSTDGVTWETLSKSVNISGLSDSETTIDGIDVPEKILSTANTINGYTLLNAQDNWPSAFDAEDEVDQQVTLYFSPQKQTAILRTDATDPEGPQVYPSTDTGYTSGPLTFQSLTDSTPVVVDATLARLGYSYQVLGPNNVWYSSLSKAIAHNATYDSTQGNPPIVTASSIPLATDNVESASPVNFVAAFSRMVGATVPKPVDPPSVPTTDDTKPQVFTVSYTPTTQAIFLQTANDPTGNQTLEGLSGLTKGAITPSNSTNANGSVNNASTFSDASLARVGFTYTIAYTNAKGQVTVYPTLAAALLAIESFDTDPSSNQKLTVNYVGDTQTALVETDKSDPTGAKLVQTLTGESNSKMPAVEQGAIYRKGYVISKVVAPDGKAYKNLTSAMAMNGKFDSNPSINGVDNQVQVFLLSYTSVNQVANIVLKNAPGKPANDIIETIHGQTNQNLRFTTTDSNLAQTGYSYLVLAPNGQTYQSLNSALLSYSKFAAEDAKDGKPVPQNFVIIYTKDKATQTASNPNNTKTGDLGHEGEQNNSLFSEIGLFELLATALSAIGVKWFRWKKKVSVSADKLDE